MSTSTKTYIAIIEDDISLCRSLSRLLEALSYQPVSYHSAEEFLDDDHHPEFDCLILDIQLGGMSGIQLSHRLVESGSKIPLIFLTAHEDWQSIKQSIDVPYSGFLHKSAPAEVLDASLKEALQTSSSVT